MNCSTVVMAAFTSTLEHDVVPPTPAPTRAANDTVPSIMMRRRSSELDINGLLDCIDGHRVQSLIVLHEQMLFADVHLSYLPALQVSTTQPKHQRTVIVIADCLQHISVQRCHLPARRWIISNQQGDLSRVHGTGYPGRARAATGEAHEDHMLILGQQYDLVDHALVV